MGSGITRFRSPPRSSAESYEGRPACTFCGFCGDGYGCWNSSKSSTLVSAIPEAEKTGKLQILTKSRVMEILSDAKGRVSGVKYRDENGTMHEQPARFVILGTYIFENTRLLLLSQAKAYPHGLGTTQGRSASTIGAGNTVGQRPVSGATESVGRDSQDRHE